MEKGKCVISDNEFHDGETCYQISACWIDSYGPKETKFQINKETNFNIAYFHTAKEAIEWNIERYKKDPPFYICKYSGEGFEYKDKCIAIWTDCLDESPSDEYIRENMPSGIAYFKNREDAIKWNKKVFKNKSTECKLDKILALLEKWDVTAQK